MVVNSKTDQRSELPDQFQQLGRVAGAFIAIAEHERAHQLAPHPQWDQITEPRAGKVSSRTQKGLATLVTQPLRARRPVESMNVLRQQRKYGNFGKQRKARCSNGAEHRGLLLEAKQGRRSNAPGGHDQLKGRGGSLFKITLAGKHRSQVGKHLRGKQRRSFEWAGHRRANRVPAGSCMKKTGCLGD